VRVRTYHNYKLQIREHIIPAFGTVKLSKLDTPNIQALYTCQAPRWPQALERPLHSRRAAPCSG
jgi:hypothetical protein